MTVKWSRIWISMPDEKKQKYYQENKQKRLEYQRSYYEKNKERIKRKRELNAELDPEWVTKQRDYNKEYYQKNKERIKLTRLARQKARSSKRDADKKASVNN